MNLRVSWEGLIAGVRECFNDMMLQRSNRVCRGEAVRAGVLWGDAANCISTGETKFRAGKVNVNHLC